MYRRIKTLLEGSKESHEVIAGGTTNDEESFIPPTIVAGVKPSDPIMQDEASVLCAKVFNFFWFYFAVLAYLDKILHGNKYTLYPCSYAC